MFEFGRDLRRLFEKARDSYDLGWLELVSVGLIETEARHQSTDAGRVSCNTPFESWMRAAALWREHGRRTGSVQSLQKAEQAGRDAANSAKKDDQAMRAALDVGLTSLLAFDLYGGPRRLTSLMNSLDKLPATRHADIATEVLTLKTRVLARQARISADPEKMAAAALQLTEAISHLSQRSVAPNEELKLDQAALALEAGILTRNARLLDQAGRDLRMLVEQALPDERPVSRARALALCGTGMAALASIASDAETRAQALALFDAAADQFTADHSPLDWATIQLLRCERGAAPDRSLTEARALTEMPGLLLGALIRERNLAHRIASAEKLGDFAALKSIQQELVALLKLKVDDTNAIDWASNQISMARTKLSLSLGYCDVYPDMGMALYEAAEVAQEAGATGLAQKARELMELMRARQV